MKALWTFVKGVLKFIFVTFSIIVIFCGIFLSMIYFSSPEQYAQVVEKGFVQVTGQTLNIRGAIEFHPGKMLNTTVKNSIITIKTKAGDLRIFANRFALGVPWNVLFANTIKLEPVEANNVQISIVKNNQVVRDYIVQRFLANIEKTCCELMISDIDITTQQGQATGNIKVLLNEPTLRINGEMSAKKWTLDKEIEPNLKIYTFQGVDDVEGEIKLTIDTLVMPKEEKKNVKAILDLKAKTLKVLSSD